MAGCCVFRQNAIDIFYMDEEYIAGRYIEHTDCERDLSAAVRA